MAQRVTKTSRRDGLTLTGYQRVFDIVDHCGDAVSLDEFRERLVESLSATFRLRYATFFVGDTLTAAFDDREGCHTGGVRAHRLQAEYHDRWRVSDVYCTPQSLDSLRTTGVATIHDLAPLPPAARAYIQGFLAPHGIAGSAVMRLELPDGASGLVGLFHDDEAKFGLEERRELRLQNRQLSIISRLLPRTRRADVIGTLVGRQLEVAHLVAGGLTNADIAARLHLSEDTVKKYVSRVLAVTTCRSRTELAVRVAQGRAPAAVTPG